MKQLALISSVVGLCLNFVVTSAWAHSAIEPAPRNEGNWKQRHESINQKVAEAGDKAQIIFIGDSITQGWEGAGKEVWERYYARRNAVNLGIGGDRTQHVLWRLDNGNLNGLQPKAAVVMIGTNNSNGEDNTPGQIVEGVAAIVRKLREKLPQTKVLLVAIFPRGENFSAQRGKLAMINQALRAVADEQNVFWIDFGHRFLNLDGTLPRELMPDYLHLSPKGYEIWAQAIEEKLAAILGDQAVKTASAAESPEATVDLTGEWVCTTQGSDGNAVEAPLVLQQTGKQITGKFARGTDRWLEIADGQIQGQQFSWIVKRDRPDGGIMVYRMSGKLEDGKIIGKTTTDINGSEVTIEWKARRK